MLAYKFRSSSQFAFTLDVLFNDRLYCADWSKLNDPMEGMFVYSYTASKEDDGSDRVAKIIREKKELRVCSLSMTYRSHLLWAHYASGFDGVAVEVELPDDLDIARKVNYDSVYPRVPENGQESDTDVAGRVLTSKYKEWEYEKEVRILQREQWFVLPNPVKRIIAGTRMNPALFECLRIICTSKGIALDKTRIGENQIDVEHVLQARPASLSCGMDRLR